MLKCVTITLVAAMAAPIALAGPAERIGRVDHRLDRREDIRDRAVTLGPRDLIEDRLDRAENIIDRRENRWDRRR